MGINTALYRIRIGLFSMPVKRGCRIRVLVVGRRSVSVCLRLAVFLSVLMLLGGDIEVNPGPLSQQKQSTLSFADVASMKTPPSSSTQCTTRSRTKKSSDSEVMCFLREMKSEMKSDLSNINSKIDDINNTVSTLKHENEILRQENDYIKNELSSLSIKLDRIEGHSRRNNLRFNGIEGHVHERWDVCEQKVRNFISDTLGLTDLCNVEIERAHRVGSTRSDKCTIIAKFNKYKDRNTILQTAREKLDSRSQYSVREDFTERVQMHRRELSKSLVEARNQGKYAALRFDKLIIDGKTYKYNDNDSKIECVGSSRFHGNQNTHNGSQRLDTRRGNNDVGAYSSNRAGFSATRGNDSGRRLANDTYTEPIGSQDNLNEDDHDL